MCEAAVCLSLKTAIWVYCRHLAKPSRRTSKANGQTLKAEYQMSKVQSLLPCLHSTFRIPHFPSRRLPCHLLRLFQCFPNPEKRLQQVEMIGLRRPDVSNGLFVGGKV